MGQAALTQLLFSELLQLIWCTPGLGDILLIKLDCNVELKYLDMLYIDSVERLYQYTNGSVYTQSKFMYIFA